MICLGQKFGSYSEVKNAIQEYGNVNFVHFSTSDSRTIESAKSRGLRKEIKQELRYAEITFSCSQSGTYKSKSKGLRKRPTQRQGCESKIRLKASEDGQFLEVVFFNEQHNHEINKEFPRKEGRRNRRNHELIRSSFPSFNSIISITADEDGFISPIYTPGVETVTVTTRRGRSSDVNTKNSLLVKKSVQGLRSIKPKPVTENHTSVPSSSKSILTSNENHVEPEPEATPEKRKRLEDQDSCCKKHSTNELLKVESNKVVVFRAIAQALERKNVILERSNEIRERKLLIEEQHNSMLLKFNESLKDIANALLGASQPQK